MPPRYRLPMIAARHFVSKGHRHVTACNNRLEQLVDRRRLIESGVMSAPAATLLMVEDDPEISRLVGEFMRREGFEMEIDGDGHAMESVLQRVRPDLFILDLMLPGEDGLSICRRLRATDNIPILMLTAKSDEIDRVVGLEMGADDYLAKPFGPRELLARVRALLRRANGTIAKPLVRRYAFDIFLVELDARSVETVESEIAALQ